MPREIALPADLLAIRGVQKGKLLTPYQVGERPWLFDLSTISTDHQLIVAGLGEAFNTLEKWQPEAVQIFKPSDFGKFSGDMSVVFRAENPMVSGIPLHKRVPIPMGKKQLFLSSAFMPLVTQDNMTIFYSLILRNWVELLALT